MGYRWMGVGRSSLPDAHAAGAEAARRALSAADRRLVIVFGALDYDPAALAQGIAAAAPGVPVIGCSTSGEIAPDGPADGTVVVTAIGGPGLAVSTAADEGIGGRQREAAAVVAACAEGYRTCPPRYSCC